MYGKTHSEETKNILRNKCKNYKDKNGMYGKTHSEETKKIIVERTGWKDPSKKKKMKKKGLLTHISNFSLQQFDEFYVYVNNIENNIKYTKPCFLNNAYSLNKIKINDLFDSFDEFYNQLEEIKNGIIN